MKSTAIWFSMTSMRGCSEICPSSASSMAMPVESWKWRILRFECPPSLPRSSSLSPFVSRRSKCIPNRMSSAIRSGPPVTTARTASSWQSPAPAARVSWIWRSNESSPLVTQATPPCAHAVFESARPLLVIRATLPFSAAFRAKLSPAMPLPMTTKSNSFMGGRGVRHCR